MNWLYANTPSPTIDQGNRKTHSRNSNTTTYTPNNLNQYTAKTNHGYLLVEGTSTNATVKVYETGSTEATATRKNNYYFRDWDPDTTSTASDYPEINIKEGTRVSDTKNAWIPVVSESPTYDANGNLTGDALWSYTYDEENRLIQMTETSAAATAGFPDTTITCKYDYLGRRVEMKVVQGTTTETHLRFVWRGWLLVAELNAASNNALVKTYTWGPDISGSFGGAGGNCGVLIFRDHTRTDNESFFPAYDAQGNVTGLIDTSGNLVAAYEYDPFGKLIRYAGTRTTSMSLLYGTKYLDMETGLIYYGYRYYDPRQGRFINRDPIGEEGGINLYGMVGNSPVNRVDYLGLDSEFVPDCGPWELTGYWREEESELEGDEKLLFWHTEYWQSGCWINVDDPLREQDPSSGDDSPGEEDETNETICAELRTALVHAQNARGAYVGQKGAPGWSVTERFDYESGLHASLFEGPNGQEMLGLRGTELSDWGDLRTNWDQAFGNIGAQYRDLARLSNNLRDRIFTIAGHSKGGGLGSVLGTLSGRATYTFNAAGIHQATMDLYGISATTANAHVRAYSVRGELLTSGQLAIPLPDAIGNPILLDPDISFSDTLSYIRAATLGGTIGYAGARAFDLHSIEETIESINKALNENNCN